jgi:DNA-binding transcriptional ArsR family regulator
VAHSLSAPPIGARTLPASEPDVARHWGHILASGHIPGSHEIRVTTAFRSLLWYLLAGTRGGPNRIRILEELRGRPHNAHQLSETLGMDYRTVRHHLKLLEQNALVTRPAGSAYASPYELTPYVAANFHEVDSVRTASARPRGSRTSMADRRAEAA